jgi:hypothetical protein
MTNPDQRFLVPEKINPIEQIDSINSPELRKLLLIHMRKLINNMIIAGSSCFFKRALLALYAILV